MINSPTRVYDRYLNNLTKINRRPKKAIHTKSFVYSAASLETPSRSTPKSSDSASSLAIASKPKISSGMLPVGKPPCALIDLWNTYEFYARKTSMEKYMKLYVGNLPWSTTDSDLSEMFGAYGSVESANVITDRESGRSRGFAFVEMDQTGGQRAMQELNGHEIDSRALKVNEANEKPKRSASY
jgi:RNA recognition motif-containing protein